MTAPLDLAAFMAFIRGVDIPNTIEAARVALVERALRAEQERDEALREAALTLDCLDRLSIAIADKKEQPLHKLLLLVERARRAEQERDEQAVTFRQSAQALQRQLVETRANAATLARRLDLIETSLAQTLAEQRRLQQ